MVQMLIMLLCSVSLLWFTSKVQWQEKYMGKYILKAMFFCDFSPK